MIYYFWKKRIFKLKEKPVYWIEGKKLYSRCYWKTTNTTLLRFFFFLIEWKKTKTVFEEWFTTCFISGLLNSWEFNQLLQLSPYLLQIRSKDAFVSQATLTKRWSWLKQLHSYVGMEESTLCKTDLKIKTLLIWNTTWNKNYVYIADQSKSVQRTSSQIQRITSKGPIKCN